MPDTFFKILGGTDPVSQNLGDMTQGIGYPLRAVEPTTAGGSVNIIAETVLSAGSIADQTPTGLGVELQVEFGAAQTTTEFDLNATGDIECLVADEYQVRGKFTVGRDGAAGESQIYVRALINGAQLGDSSHVIVDNSRIEIPFDKEFTLALSVGDILTFEIIRDTDGNDSGGLTAGNPDVPGWNPSPSARILITRFLAVQA